MGEVVQEAVEKFDTSRSLEQLEGSKWGSAPAGSTVMVEQVHALRRKAVSALAPDELARLIGQDVGLMWLIPLAVEGLLGKVPEANRGGWFEEDLLSVVLTRDLGVWRELPEAAQKLRKVMADLSLVAPYLQREAEPFLAL